MGSGDGVPVLLLHGFGADLNSWMFTQPALAEGRRTFALDLPGHGGSSKDVGAGDAARFTDAVEAALAALEIERVHLVGHSMGGAVAVSLAARRPERVATLTLIAPAGLGPEINGGFIDGFVRASRRREAWRRCNSWCMTPRWSAARWWRTCCATSAWMGWGRRWRRLRARGSRTGGRRVDLIAAVRGACHAGAGDLGTR